MGRGLGQLEGLATLLRLGRLISDTYGLCERRENLMTQLAERVLGENESGHRIDHGNRAGEDTGIVSSLCLEGHFISRRSDGLLR